MVCCNYPGPGSQYTVVCRTYVHTFRSHDPPEFPSYRGRDTSDGDCAPADEAAVVDGCFG